MGPEDTDEKPKSQAQMFEEQMRDALLGHTDPPEESKETEEQVPAPSEDDDDE